MGKTLGYGEITVANMTEPFTVMLTNEAQQFATDSNRKVTSAQSYYTDIIVIRGSQERTDYTIGNITSGSGITVSKNSKRVTFSVSAGTTIGADAGVIEIPITLDGQTVKKQFSWSCGKQGPQGVKGNDGNSFAWNMLSETNCGKKHWGTESSGGKYSVEDFITEDNIDAVKLICTEAISTSNWSYVSFKDIKMLKQLQPSTKYTLSYDIKANRSGAISHSICKGDVSNFCTNTVVVNNIIGNETWQHISVVLTTNDLKTTPTNEILYLGRNALSKVGYSIIKNLKLVEGDIDTPWSPSQSDIEGKGVVETVQYYLATSQASGVTSSTSGWSTDITTQKLTADKKYLWNCYQTKYSDGTSEPISTPKVIGVYGDKGTSTKIIRTSYEYTQTNIDKFSTSGYSGVWGVNDATTGLKVGDSVLLKVKNTTKCSDCLIFANITAIPSNYSLTCTSYGVIDNGSDGQDGAGFHWNLLKYSGDLSKQVLGGAGTYTATVESIEDKTTPSGQAEKITYTVQGTGGKFIQTGKYIKEGDIKQGKTYTVSVWCKCSSIKSTGVINAEFLDNKTYVNPTLSTEWQQYVVTGVANKDVTSTSSASAISFYYSDNMSVGDIFYISSPKVEEGDKASPWCTTYEETLAKNLTITPSSQYFKSTDGGKTFAPNTITIRPTIQGEISFGKWQYSIDGGVSFADVVSGQKGLTISNNVLTVSKDSSLYSDAVTMVTFRAVASDSSFYDTCSIAKIYDVSDIGDGRNLIQKSQLNPIDGAELSLDDYTKNGTVIFTNKSKNSGFSFDSYNNYQPNSKYVLSYYFTKTSGTINSFGGFHNGKRVVYTSFFVDDKVYDTASYAGGSSQIGTILNDGKRHRIVVCYTTPDTIATDTSINYTFIQPGRGNTNPNFGVKIEELKLEKGSSPTGWSPAPEDVQTAILSTKSEISDVSLKVDKNKQAIEQRVEKTTYQQDLNLVKDDISKANEGLNKWRYEIYPKSLFTDKPEDQNKYDIGVFIRNKNLTPSRTLVFDDNKWTLLDYENNYIGYGLTFVKMSAKKTFSTKWAHSSSCSIYVNGKLIISDKGTVRLDSNNIGRDFNCTFIEGWNCIEFVMQETTGNEWFFFKDAISAISECQLMNCYYGTPVARQSHITNQLVQNTTDIDGVSGSVQQVMSTVGGSGKVDEFVNNYSTWKKKVDGIENRVGETYTTKSDFNGLEIGGRNLARDTSNEYSTPYTNFNGSTNTCFYDKRVYLNGLKAGDTITVHMYVKYDDIVPTSGQTARMWTQGSGNVTVWNSGTFPASSRQSLSGSGVCEILYSATVYKDSEKNQYWECCIRTDYIQSGSMQIKSFKVEKGNKPTDWTPAPEDDEINGQNLVSNLPSNWEQGTVTEGSAIGTTYANTKSSSAGSIRPKELIPVSGDITISIAYSNQSKKPIRHWIAAYDVNKNYLGNNYVSNAWNSFPRTLDIKDAKYIAIMVGYTDSSAITPSDISQICLKIERGTSATPFTLAPEDVNGKIVNVETIANQTAKKFEWIVKGGDSSSNFTLTDRVADLVAERINFKGLVKFSGLSTDAKSDILNSFEVGGINLISDTRDMKSWAKGGKLTITYDQLDIKNNTNAIKVVNSKSTAGNAYLEPPNRGPLSSGKYTVSFYAKTDSTSGADVSVLITDEYTKTFKINNIWTQYIITFDVANDIPVTNNFFWFNFFGTTEPIYFCYVKLEKGNKPTDWSPNPEDYLPQANLVSNWTTNSTWIDGGKIYTGSITADKIATDAIKSRNYISSGGTQGSFLNLSDGSFQSPNLSWDANGNLIAKNATLSGEITATNGSIAGWTIISNKMYTTGSGKYTGIGKYGSAYAFWAGATSNDNGNSAVFKVGHTGKLTATDADITGTITATNGKIGRYDITSTYLMTNSGSNASGIGGNQAFWAGAEDSNSAPFRVGYDGVLWAENAAIRGSIETGNLGDEGDTVSIINGHIGIQGTSNNVEIYSTGFKFGIDGDYYLMSVSEGVKCYRNLYATDFVADGWLYCSEVHSSGAVVIGADSESFYWAHGYQIARGTSWGGVCVGDDSQQLRLYGSSIWASHSISTSDENLKENFTTLDQYENFYMNLNPIGFNYIGDYDGKKTHFGFGAHKTEDVLESEGYDADKFAVVTHRPLVQEDIEKRFGKDVEVDIETEYGVSYTEFIALNTHMIQKTRRELTKVKQEKADLEVRLQAIEAKLGL